MRLPSLVLRAMYVLTPALGLRPLTARMPFRIPARAAASAARAAAGASVETLGELPELVVFDMDMCLWSPEMYTLDEIPEKTVVGKLGDAGEGVVGVKSGMETIRLFPDALKVLQKYHAGEYGTMRIAAASSADTPFAVKVARQALTMLEVVPGVTVREVFSMGWPDDCENMQIGRSPPLSSNKARTHFPILRPRERRGQLARAHDHILLAPVEA